MPPDYKFSAVIPYNCCIPNQNYADSSGHQNMGWGCAMAQQVEGLAVRSWQQEFKATAHVEVGENQL